MPSAKWQGYSDLAPHRGCAGEVGIGATKSNNIAHFSWYSDQQRPGKAYTNLAMYGNLSLLKSTYEESGVPGMLMLQKSRWGINYTADTGIVVHVTHSIFNHNSHYSALSLTSTWEAAVDDCIAAVTPLAKGNGGHIHGIQLGDELVCGGGFPLSNLSALAARLHDGLSKHGVFIFTNECFNQGAACKTDKDCGPPTHAGGARGSGWGPPVCMNDASQPGVVFPGCQAAVWPEIPAGLDAISLDIYYQVFSTMHD